MNKWLNILWLSLLTLWGIYLAFSEEEVPFDEVSKAAGVIAVVENDSLLSKYEFIIDNQKKFEEASLESEKRLQDVFQRTEYYELLSYMENSTGKEKEQSAILIQKAEEIIKESQVIESEKLESLRQAYLEELSSNVKAYLGGFCDEHNISLVLNYYPETGNVLYYNKVLNLTDEVIEGLNKEYRRKKK